MSPEEKVCPHCGGVIKAIAIKCKYCKADLIYEPPQNKSSQKNIKVKRKINKKWYLGLMLPILTTVTVYLKQQHLGRDFFGNVIIDCDNKNVVQTLKKLIRKNKNYTPEIVGITTDSKEDGYRDCFALMTIKELNIEGAPITYYVRRTDDKKSFTVLVETGFDYDSLLNDLLKMGN